MKLNMTAIFDSGKVSKFTIITEDNTFEEFVTQFEKQSKETPKLILQTVQGKVILDTNKVTSIEFGQE